MLNSAQLLAVDHILKTCKFWSTGHSPLQVGAVLDKLTALSITDKPRVRIHLWEFFTPWPEFCITRVSGTHGGTYWSRYKSTNNWITIGDWTKPSVTFDSDIVKVPPQAWSKQRPPLSFNPEKVSRRNTKN